MAKKAKKSKKAAASKKAAKRKAPAKKASAKRKKDVGGTDSVMLNLKAHRSEKLKLLANAKKYVNGNFSLWMRLAGLHFKPTAAQLAAAL